MNQSGGNSVAQADDRKRTTICSLCSINDRLQYAFVRRFARFNTVHVVDERQCFSYPDATWYHRTVCSQLINPPNAQRCVMQSRSFNPKYVMYQDRVRMPLLTSSPIYLLPSDAAPELGGVSIPFLRLASR